MMTPMEIIAEQEKVIEEAVKADIERRIHVLECLHRKEINAYKKKLKELELK